jgi:hypothetical protein
MQMTISTPPILLYRPFIRPAGALARSAAPVIGVAGASGKSTTTGLIEALTEADRMTEDDCGIVALDIAPDRPVVPVSGQGDGQ